MSVKILNREFKHPADGWYQVEAKGYHPALAEGGIKVVQVVDDKAIASICNRFNADAAAGTLTHGNEMLIDHEHFRHDPKQETAAYGWANKLRPSPDGSGFDTFNPWTDTGKQAVDGGTYRFTSTEYDGAVGDVFEEVAASEIPADIRNRYQGFTFLRPLRLTGLSLTNAHNNKGQKAITITNRGGGRHTLTDLDVPPGGGPSRSQTTNQRNQMKQIAVELGLDANTDEAGILTVVRSLKNRGDITAADLLTLRNRERDLAADNQTLLGEQVEALMDAHGLKADDKVRTRLKPVLISLKNREDRIGALTDFGFDRVEAAAEETAPAAGAGQVKLKNRDTRPPAGKPAAGAEATPEQAAANAQKAEAAVQEYRLQNRCTYDQARNAVRRTKPELFGVQKPG